MAATADIPLLITSENASSERRVTPSWTVAHLKGRLEPITGIPASCQRLLLKVASQTSQAIEAADEEATQLSQWPLQPYAEIHVGTFARFSLTFRAKRTWACVSVRMASLHAGVLDPRCQERR